MGLKDVAGIFSRRLVIGFFLPVFFLLVSLSQLLTDHLLPDFYSGLKGDGSRILVIGGISAFGGLLLSGLHFNVLRLFEGYPLERRQDKWPLKYFYGRGMRKQCQRFHELEKARQSTSQSPVQARERSRARQALAQRYPTRCQELLPTSFGNAVRSFERHPRARWGLNGVVIWPRIELLLSKEQLDLHSSAQTDVAFFVNFTFLSALSGIVFTCDWLQYTALPRSWSWVLLAIPFMIAVCAYRASVGAAVRWGDEVRASFDMYRLDFYRRLGVRLPQTHAEEILIAKAVNRCLAYGEALPGAVRQIAPSPEPNQSSR